MLKAIGSKVDLGNDPKGEGYYLLVSDLLENETVLKMKKEKGSKKDDDR